MELRSTHRKNEYKKLQSTLSSMGYYEEGMELQEMRQVIEALQLSATETETKFSESDMQHALRESELDFMPVQDGLILNSTMMSINLDTPPSSSNVIDDTQSERIVVHAQVHHAMDWSPTTDSLPRKHSASTRVEADMPSNSIHIEKSSESLEPDSKCLSQLCISYKKLQQEDNNSLQYDDIMENSAENFIEISASVFHEIRGPVSERRIHDSGLIESTSSSALSNSTASPTNTLSNQQSPSSMHEIQGPISVRRIHDSGLNLSPEALNSSSFYNAVEHSLISLENSANGAENHNEPNHDLEQ